jgi:tetratricopeptide (TPR) repeat protein
MTSKNPQILQLHQLAQKAMKEGRLRDAHQHCLAILKLDQGYADAWFLCAVIAAHNGQQSKAAEILNNAITLAPQNAEYQAELGKQLIAINQPQKALRAAEAALALEPSKVPVLNTLGTVFSHVGEHGYALQCFNQALQKLQNRATAQGNLSAQWRAELNFNRAASLQFSGLFDEAEAGYEAAIALEPDMFKAHSALSTLRRQTPEVNHLQRLEELRPKVKDGRDQLHLGHAIAKEQEDLGDYANSFQSLAWAKREQVKLATYRVEDDAKLFGRIAQLFHRDFLSQNQIHCESDEPIFIAGMPRTGTTLVEQVLSSHSQVFAAGELQNFPMLVKQLAGSETPDALDLATFNASVDLDFTQLGAAYIDSTRPRTGHRPHFIDKLPLNFMYLGLIKRAIPNAKLVCLRRDPMDTCLSNYRQMFAINFKHYHYNYDLLDCGRYYILFDKLMRHWKEMMPGSIHEVQYEELVANPEQISRGLVEHCKLDWEDQCLSFHQRETSVATPSAVQVRQGIYSSSVNRWRRYGDEMKPLYELLQSAGLYD